MTLLHIDSFDTYTVNADLKTIYQVHNSGVTPAVTGRFSVGSSVRIPNGRWIGWNLPTPLSTVIFGFAAYVVSIQRDGRVFIQLINSQSQIVFQFLWYDDAPRFIYNNIHYIATGHVTEGWHYFEIKFVVGASNNGSVTVNIDGTQVINATSITTSTVGNASVIRLMGFDDVRFSGTAFDDFYVCDTNGSINNSFLGPVKARYYLPTANGDTNNWTASTGSNNTCIDDTPPFNTTDYVSTTGVGNKDNYTFATVSGFGGVVNGVTIYLVATQTDVELKSIRALAKSGGTEVTSATQQTFNSFYPHEMVFETDPNTSSAWVQANINSAYFGIKLES